MQGIALGREACLPLIPDTRSLPRDAVPQQWALVGVPRQVSHACFAGPWALCSPGLGIPHSQARAAAPGRDVPLRVFIDSPHVV